MPHRLFILTGASRGLGAAIAQQLLAPQRLLLCIARHPDDGLSSRASAAGAQLEQWPLDLTLAGQAATRLQAWLGSLDAQTFEQATLINNAAALTRAGPIEDCDGAELEGALRVGLEAPLLLTAAFLRATRAWPAEKRCLNISSGLGRRPMAGLAPYCAAKAGLDHFTRALALDEARRSNGAKVVSLAPGVIDTEMQGHLRAADDAGFPDKARFVALKQGGNLRSASDAAARVLHYLAREDFGSDPVAELAND